MPAVLRLDRAHPPEVSYPPAWTERAACGYEDPEIFYPLRGQSPLPAKQICCGCPVRALCLDEALARNETDGVWGGLTPEERRWQRQDRGLG